MLGDTLKAPPGPEGLNVMLEALGEVYAVSIPEKAEVPKPTTALLLKFAPLMMSVFDVPSITTDEGVVPVTCGVG